MNCKFKRSIRGIEASAMQNANNMDDDVERASELVR